MKSLILKSDIPLETGEPRAADLSEVARRARLVLEIVPGERRLLPELGCRIHEIDLSRAASREVAAVFVEEALERWTPQLGVERAEVREAVDGKIEVRLLKADVWHRLWISHRLSRGKTEA